MILKKTWIQEEEGKQQMTAALSKKKTTAQTMSQTSWMTRTLSCLSSKPSMHSRHSSRVGTRKAQGLAHPAEGQW